MADGVVVVGTKMLRAFRFEVLVAAYPAPDNPNPEVIRLRATRVEPGPTEHTLRIYVGVAVEDCNKETLYTEDLPLAGALIIKVIGEEGSEVLRYAYDYRMWAKFPAMHLDATDSGYAGECYEFEV